MNLLKALEFLRQPILEPVSHREISLQCGFTPLHFKTFLAAYLRQCFPKDSVHITQGLYGDLVGNLERFRTSDGITLCIVVEWADLDPRIGIRSLGGWRSTDIPDIVESARRNCDRLLESAKRLAENAPICVQHANASPASHVYNSGHPSAALRMPTERYRCFYCDLPIRAGGS